MNQILYTGGKKGKTGNHSDIKKIVIFFAIFVLLFAICLIAIGANLLNKVEENKNTSNTIPNTPVQEANIDIKFSSVVGGVKLNITSDIQLKKIDYWWDNETPTTIDVNATSYDTTIKTRQGTHTLKVDVTDINGNIESKDQLVIGDSEPELTISTDGISNYVITASDDEQLKKIIIKINDQTNEIDLNQAEFEYTVPIPTGDSFIDVTVYNINDLSVNKKAKITGFGQ